MWGGSTSVNLRERKRGKTFAKMEAKLVQKRSQRGSICLLALLFARRSGIVCPLSEGFAAARDELRIDDDLCVALDVGGRLGRSGRLGPKKAFEQLVGGLAVLESIMRSV